MIPQKLNTFKHRPFFKKTYFCKKLNNMERATKNLEILSTTKNIYHHTMAAYSINVDI